MAKVLIVDDSQTILARLTDGVCKTLKYEVVQAMNYEETKIRLSKHDDIDIALLDLGLPDASGEDIVDLVQKANIPIVVLTGSGNESMKQLIAQKDIIDYVIKDGSYAVEYAISVIKRYIGNKNHTILIVDDSKTFAAKISSLCDRYYLKSIIASSGKEALEILSNNDDVTLCFIDYMMPGMNGLELTTEIRKQYAKDSMSIIALSGSGEQDIVAKFLKYGANDFISKEFSMEEFYARLNSSLENLELFEEIKILANSDYLTGHFNRRYFFDKAYKIYDKARKDDTNLSVALLDVDNFKKINDTYGHDVGDLVLKHLSKLIKNEIECEKLASRFGGEEFCLLFEKQDSLSVLKILENFRKVVEKGFIKLVDDKKIYYTVSIGVCWLLSDSLDGMIKNADIALYEAKKSGKNKIEIYNCKD